MRYVAFAVLAIVIFGLHAGLSFTVRILEILLDYPSTPLMHYLFWSAVLYYLLVVSFWAWLSERVAVYLETQSDPVKTLERNARRARL